MYSAISKHPKILDLQAEIYTSLETHGGFPRGTPVILKVVISRHFYTDLSRIDLPEKGPHAQWSFSHFTNPPLSQPLPQVPAHGRKPTGPKHMDGLKYWIWKCTGLPVFLVWDIFLLRLDLVLDMEYFGSCRMLCILILSNGRGCFAGLPHFLDETYRRQFHVLCFSFGML